MSKATPLLQDEVWSDTIWKLAGDVANSLRPSELSGHTLLMIVHNAAIEMLASRFDDFFPITEHPTSRTTYYVTMAFLADKFRVDLTKAANERLLRHGNPPRE